MRGFVYLVGSGPMYIVESTILIALLYLFPCGTFFYAALIGERYIPAEGSRRSIISVFDSIFFCFEEKKQPQESLGGTESVGDVVNKTYTRLQRSSKIGQIVFVIIFSVACAIVFIVNYAGNNGAFSRCVISHRLIQ